MHSRLEEYLDTVEKPLTSLPKPAREEWREEARQHLESLVAAHEELGSSREEAVEAALLQFGDAQAIGVQMRRATIHDSDGWRAASVAFALVGLPLVVWMAVLTVIGMSLLNSSGTVNMTLFYGATAAGYAAVPLMGGWWAGRYCRRHRLLFPASRRRAGMVYLPWMALAMAQYVIMGTVFFHFAFSRSGVPDFNFLTGLPWIPMTMAGFQMGRGKKRRRALAR